MQSIIIRGPLGVGKSTVGPALAQRVGGVYVSVDRVLEQHGLDHAVEGEGIPLENFLKANALIVVEAKRAYDEGRTIVIDGNFYHREQVDQLVDLLGEGVMTFTLKASVETCIARDAARARPYGEDAARAVHMFVSAFDYGVIIDTEHQDLEATVQSVMHHVAKPNVILTSSFSTVAKELKEKSLLPQTASVAFIPTAGDPYPSRPWMEADRNALVTLGYSVTDVDLKNKTAELLNEELAHHDIIFVAGGNTTYLVQQSHASGFTSLVRNLLGQGKLYIGSSAGSLLAGPTVEPFVDEDLTELPKDFVLTDPSCLHLVDYVVLPHDNVPQFSAEHDKIVKKYAEQFTFVRITDKEYLGEFVGSEK